MFMAEVDEDDDGVSTERVSW